MTSLVSVALHAVAVGIVGYFALRSFEAKRVAVAQAAQATPAPALALELPVFDLGTLLADREPDPSGVEPTPA
jgi:hypothetical protein